jgi:hypothetical protein
VELKVIEIFDDKKKRERIEGLVPVAQASSLLEAELIKAALNNENIDAFILNQQDRNYILTFGSWSKVVIIVPEEDVEQAKMIINKLKSEEFSLDEDDITDDGEIIQP